MTYFRWLLFLIVLVPGLSTAQQAPPATPTMAEIRAELLGSPTSRFALQEETLPAAAEKKSVGLAALYSLLIPGMGEAYAGEFGSSGKYFLLAEGLLWLTYGIFEWQGDALQTDARTFSAVSAGVNVAGKDDQFFVDVGNFLTVDDYNQKKLQDRQPEKLYDPAAGYAWSWDTDENRQTFRDQRIAADNMYNNQKFVLLGVILNHVASAINAGRAAVAHNSALGAALENVELHARVMGSPARAHGVLLTVQKGL